MCACVSAPPHSTPQLGNIRVTHYRWAGCDHPTSTHGGRFNEQMVNEGRLNGLSEIIYRSLFVVCVAWRGCLYRSHMYCGSAG